MENIKKIKEMLQGITNEIKVVSKLTVGIKMDTSYSPMGELAEGKAINANHNIIEVQDLIKQLQVIQSDLPTSEDEIPNYEKFINDHSNLMASLKQVDTIIDVITGDVSSNVDLQVGETMIIETEDFDKLLADFFEIKSLLSYICEYLDLVISVKKIKDDLSTPGSYQAYSFDELINVIKAA